MYKQKKATINDVANAAGVSKKTVSRVINGEKNVKLATRLKIQAAIKELNYKPDPQARGLAFKRSFLLSIVYDNPNSSFVSDAMYGVLDQCRPQGYELVIHPCDTDKTNWAEGIIEFVQQLKIDGVILLPPLSDTPLLSSALEKVGCHCVRLYSNRQPSTTDSATSIHFNDYAAMSHAANHLSDLGHTKIGFITGSKGSRSASERLEGFQDALAARNIKLPPKYIAKGEYTFESGVSCAEWLLNLTERPTAIVASNDEMAIGAMVAARKKGLNIPSDLSIIGFDDSPFASKLWPSLTTIDLHVRKMCQLATQKLTALCANNIELAKTVKPDLDPTFIQRQSTAEPPSIQH